MYQDTDHLSHRGIFNKIAAPFSLITYEAKPRSGTVYTLSGQDGAGVLAVGAPFPANAHRLLTMRARAPVPQIQDAVRINFLCLQVSACVSA